MPTYMTKQRKNLINFLDAHPHETFSVMQVIAHFEHEAISTSSVYRNLAELEASGVIRRVSKNGAREAYYQYAQAERCRNQVHLRCRVCEKLFHMRGETVQMLLARVLEEQDFVIDIGAGETVISGLCAECRARLEAY